MDDKDFRRRKFLREHPDHQSVQFVVLRKARAAHRDRTGNTKWWELSREEEAWLTRNRPHTPLPDVAQKDR